MGRRAFARQGAARLRAPAPASALVLALVLALAFALLPVLARAQGSKVSSAPELARAIETLKPGEWVWAPEVAPEGPVLVFVDLSRQIALVYRNGIRIGATTVSTGKPGHATPTGVFTILQKDAKHRSSTYNNAPMPYQQRLTWDGVALHAGGLPGYPESHGCVHLPYNFARELFTVTELGVTVVVEGDAQHHLETSGNALLSPFDDTGKAIAYHPLRPDEQFHWTPDVAREGPVSVIVSKLDQRIVVLRGGKEIGRSVARIRGADAGSHVVTQIVREGKPHWVFVGMAGHEEEEGREIDEALLNRVEMPRAFHRDLDAVMGPGTTVLVTNSRVGAGAWDHLTVIDAIHPHAAPEGS
ncbi:L,D-transpeptidase family protein [Novosphingobium sp. MBES04]|uniref:L,D-transpeptidase family protein n=1 Tax=Novosphingobium sp. MBES04 TaxID=1206458 RepID=UPI00072380B7|nr:L,D-transpeptidase family protein [Novosphingobium sp. MBES04]GAM06585.1 ErfK/YbiS/YcfS/YnhG family protein [Novosphingobium sp. MBES04]